MNVFTKLPFRMMIFTLVWLLAKSKSIVLSKVHWVQPNDTQKSSSDNAGFFHTNLTFSLTQTRKGNTLRLVLGCFLRTM